MYELPEARPLDGHDLVAIILSVFAPGLGHVLLGQKVKGIVILALVVASCGVGYLMSALVALDAYCLARARKQRSVGDWELFPESEQNLGL
jgi:TM2 domain-containing membrane protein YozV